MTNKTKNVPGTLFFSPTGETIAWRVDDDPPDGEISLGDIVHSDVVIFICLGVGNHDVFLTKFGVCHLTDSFLNFAINANVE